MMKTDNPNQLLNWTFMRKATTADIVRRIQTGDNPNECDGGKSTPLHKAIQARNFDAFRALVESGADPSVLSESEYDFEIEQAIRNSNGYSDLSNLRKI